MSRRMRQVPLGQVIKGKVTNVNAYMMSFEVEERFRVYGEFSNILTPLPSLNDNVEIIGPKKFYGSTYTAVMGPNTIYNIIERHGNNYPQTDTKDSFLKLLISKDALDADEVIAVDQIVRNLEPFLNAQEIGLCLKILYEHVCNNSHKKSFQKINSKTPKQLCYANNNSELYSFLNYDGKCMFNAYPNTSGSDCMSEHLFGYLVVSKAHGYFTLKDDTSEILVKFSMPFDELYKFHNCIVLINKYTVFTEIYEDQRQPTLPYILMNAEDVIVVTSRNETPRLFYGVNDLHSSEIKYSFYLQLNRKSEVIYGYNNSPECWMQGLVSLKEDFCQTDRIYLILPQELLEIVPFLREHIVYKITSNQGLKSGNIMAYKELYGMRELKKVFVLSCDSVFHETKLCPLEITSKCLEDFQEVKSYIANMKDPQAMLSFVLKIDRKELQSTTYASWYPMRHDHNKHFGDTEKLQQRLIFRDGSTNEFIDFYLSNRENHVIPLGLISEMKVKVKHVQVNKNKYLKATVFTSFDIMEYCPEIRFSSASLSFSQVVAHQKCFRLWQWRTKSAPTPLSMYRHIPAKCVVHGTVLFRAVLDLHISAVCAKCRRPFLDECCSRCETNNRDFDVFMVLHVQDAAFPAFGMEIDNICFLLDLLGLRNVAPDQVFEQCFPPLDINFLKIPEGYVEEDSSAVIQKIVTMIRSRINYKWTFLIDVVCVRQLAEGRKPWKIIEYEFLPELNHYIY